jgi:hypothetical protein
VDVAKSVLTKRGSCDGQDAATYARAHILVVQNHPFPCNLKIFLSAWRLQLIKQNSVR